MEITIRELAKEDMAEVKVIFEEFVRYHEQWDDIFEKIASAADMWGAYAHNSHTQDDNCRVLVAELDGHVVGYCLGRITEKPPIYRDKLIGEVDNIAVKEEHKRRGIGERLYTAINEWFRERGVDHVEIEAASANPQSVSFWKKMGGREFIKRMEIRM
jgi:ribosomal protein S18 acetylase RimI-like enzyme